MHAPDRTSFKASLLAPRDVAPAFDLPHDALESALRSPENAVSFGFGRSLVEHASGRHVLETADHAFDIGEFVRLGRAVVEPHASIYSQLVAFWHSASGKTVRAPRTTARVVTFGDQRFDVVTLTFREGYGQTTVTYVIGDDAESVESFFEAVCAACHVPERRVLVFAHGCWTKSERLFKAIEASSFDDLVLAGGLGTRIRDDVGRFLAAKADYARFGVPFKRGILLVGPPGNGKTHCLRAILNHARLPVLYVKSVKVSCGEEEANVARVFEKARSLAPCVLVLEDLDSLITQQNLSSFLNEMDGLAGDTGVLTIATTNHPETLDPALLDRPSRFDRKYHFSLPGLAERLAYAERWNLKLDPAMRIDLADVTAIARATDGFSFAYLKELFVSSMLVWMETQSEGTMPTILRSELETLIAQRKS